ncbi:MAG: protein phosphatase 2C domain-containing protein [Pseudomonadota bacterium]
MMLDKIRYSAATHRGSVRAINEDSILSLPELGVWIVSDGMGGHEGGDFASQTVVEAVAMLPLNLEGADLVAAVNKALDLAHKTILREAERRGGKTMGATVVALVVTEAHYVTLWSGDSRLYRLRDGQLDMISSDHSLVAELVRAGKLTWDAAEHQPQSNAITRAVGVGDALELETVSGTLRPGDRYLLCSDGLTKYANSHLLRQVMATTAIERVSDRFVEIALAGGGADNVSLIVVDIP